MFLLWYPEVLDLAFACPVYVFSVFSDEVQKPRKRLTNLQGLRACKNADFFKQTADLRVPSRTKSADM